MRILADIGHPAHVHVLRNALARLEAGGHEILVTSRRKEFATELLDELGLRHETLSGEGRGGVLALARELVGRDLALLGVARRFRPQVMTGVGGTFVAHVGFLTGTRTVVFYDTENARLQNAITYPLASTVVVPECYRGWTPRRTVRYRGYHELAYLAPGLFTPDRELAIANGLAPQGDTFLLRMVSWRANHDLTESGWTPQLAERVVALLAGRGKVLLSSEAPLGAALERYRYRGRVSAIHHVMAHCRAFVGESATMASECAVLGVPAVYAAHTGRGYTDEQEARYGLVRNVRRLEWQALREAVETLLAHDAGHYRRRREALLAECEDVTALICRMLTDER